MKSYFFPSMCHESTEDSWEKETKPLYTGQISRSALTQATHSVPGFIHPGLCGVHTIAGALRLMPAETTLLNLKKLYSRQSQ